MALNPGDVIDGKYRIVRLLGEGGMGAVFEGENIRIHRRVAIKVLHGGVAENADAVQRFEREAQAAGRIGSEHIVEVLDLGNLESGDRYMVMEFLDGSSLSDRIQARGRMTPGELYPIARQILDGLEAAHGAGIIHRDLKPDNVFLVKARAGQADFVKLLDFGISKFQALSGDSGFSMTRTGAVMGTPYYMSPEQAKGAKTMDHRADLYAVGVIFYECVTGQVPFNADTFNELLFKIVLETPPPIQQLVPDIDPNFAAIIDKAMSREPAHRFANSAEFREALDAWAAGSPQAIAVAPRVAQPSAAALPPGAANTPSAALKSTPEPWSQSSPDMAAPKRKSSAGLFVALGVGGLVVLGGVAAFALQGKSASADKPPEVASVPAAAEPKPGSTATAEKKPEPVAEVAPPPATSEAPPASPEKAAEPARTATRTQAAGKPQPASKPTTGKPEVAPPPPPPATTGGGGRKIREDL